MTNINTRNGDPYIFLFERIDSEENMNVLDPNTSPYSHTYSHRYPYSHPSPSLRKSSVRSLVSPQVSPSVRPSVRPPIASTYSFGHELPENITTTSTDKQIDLYVDYYLTIGNVIDINEVIKQRLIEFIKYQLGRNGKVSFINALDEIRKCKKISDWIWYIIPSTIGDTPTAKKFLINRFENSPLTAAHYLMIPYLKKNYETIITEIYKCLETYNIQKIKIMGSDIDVIKFNDSIKHFLTAYNNISTKEDNKIRKQPSDYKFINILYALNTTLNPIKSKSTKKIHYNHSIKKKQQQQKYEK